MALGSLRQETWQMMGETAGEPEAGRQRPRIVFYSHDAMGLGHARRNLLLAGALARSPLRPDIILTVGSAEACAFNLPPGTDLLVLPALTKDAAGAYVPRRLQMPLADLIGLRSEILFRALTSSPPDLLVVDKKPRGVLRELEPALARLRRLGRTRVVLGLRDVLDDPETIRRDWQRSGQEQAICDYFDEVWVYGDPRIYDLRSEYGLSPAVSAKVRFAGYLDQRLRVDHAAGGPPPQLPDLPPGRLAVCLCGGGEDGASLAEAFVGARFGPEWNSVLLTGPLLPREIEERLLRLGGPRTRILRWSSEPTAIIARADRVITMGGYNSVAEVLSFAREALVVPRVFPRQEQLIRAERLAAPGYLDLLHPADLSPRALEEWVAREPRPRPSAVDRIDFGGTDWVVARATALLAPGRRTGSLRAC